MNKIKTMEFLDKHDGSYEDFMNIAKQYELLSEHCQQVIDIVDKHANAIHEIIEGLDEHIQKLEEIKNKRV